MKVILLQDVKALGKKGEIVEVSEGYARNCIFKKKLGVEANNTNLNDLKLQKANDQKVAQQQLEDAQAFAQKLEQLEVVVEMKAGEGGRTFGSISSKEIVQAAKEQHGVELDKKKLQLADPIKSFGYHEVTAKLHPKVTAKLRVKVQEKK